MVSNEDNLKTKGSRPNAFKGILKPGEHTGITAGNENKRDRTAYY